jgi:ATP-dependent DNA helicase DinG
VNQARKKALEADLVVVNHHLFFSDLTLKSDGFGELLPEHDTVIFDEAHSLADIASKFFGFSISSYQLRDLLSDIMSAEKEEKSGVGFGEVYSELENSIRAFTDYAGRIVKDPQTLESLISSEFELVFRNLYTSLSNLQSALEKAAPAGEGLARCHIRCVQVVSNVGEWKESRNTSTVAWMEGGQGFFRLHITPMDIGKEFGPYLQDSGKSWVFTSATLAVGDDFSGFFKKLGLQDAQAVRWDSPYDFQSNSLLYLPPELPDPRDPTFADGLANTIIDVTRASRGRAFCLFTSHFMMEKVYKLVADQLEWPCIKQGDAAKIHLLEKFLQTENSVLFGTTSFWQGVDVQGESLSCVIIDKLPFEAPSDPVLKSQLKQCEEQGGVPFMDIQLPDAVISLKQGAGRLIRSESDTGVLVICDSRITTKSYGKLFINSLPDMPVTRHLGDVEQFFER